MSNPILCPMTLDKTIYWTKGELRWKPVRYSDFRFLAISWAFAKVSRAAFGIWRSREQNYLFLNWRTFWAFHSKSGWVLMRSDIAESAVISSGRISP